MALLGAAYPVAAHIATLTGRPALIAASLGLLVTLVLLPGLRSGRPLAWIMWVAAGLALLAAARTNDIVTLLLLPPVLISGFMAWAFGHTLRRGETPLVERFARAVHGPDDPLTDAMVAYARQVTVVWACFLATLAVVNLFLAACARPGGLLLAAGVDPPVAIPLDRWSLFANVLSYGLIGALFVAELAVRRLRFPRRTHVTTIDFVRRLAGPDSPFRLATGGRHDLRPDTHRRP